MGGGSFREPKRLCVDADLIKSRHPWTGRRAEGEGGGVNIIPLFDLSSSKVDVGNGSLCEHALCVSSSTIQD